MGQTVDKLLKIEFVYSLLYFKIKLTLKSLIEMKGPTLSPGTARACSLGRRAVPGGVTVPNSNQLNYSKIKINTINMTTKSMKAA